MGMETLNTAARAAGFAMASDEFLNDGIPEQPVAETNAWRPGEAVLLGQGQERADAKAGPSFTDWIKGLFGTAGRRAPA